MGDVMMEENSHVHLGPNQRRILQLLKKRRKMSQREIAEVIYEKPVKTGSYEYIAVNRSLQNLYRRGLLEKTTMEIQWSLKRISKDTERKEKTE